MDRDGSVLIDVRRQVPDMLWSEKFPTPYIYYIFKSLFSQELFVCNLESGDPDRRRANRTGGAQ